MPFYRDYGILLLMTLRNVPCSAFERPGHARQGGSDTVKVLKALLAIFTFLAAALTCTLLFVQDRNAPHYIKIYENEQ